MNQEKVKITGLAVNQQFGILKAVKMQFDEKNRLIAFKGETGSGKTTAQRALQLGTQGSKTLTDNSLYGDVDIETQLIDGDTPLFVGCRLDKKNKLQYTLYMKDKEGNKIQNPVIDGVKATPSKYMETLQTKLTWRMDELTSENPTVQKKILFELYGDELKKIGVDEILNKIDEAKSRRNELDAIRKQKGGIKEDLQARGIDPDRPDSIPSEPNIAEIEDKIKKVEREKTIAETEAGSRQRENLQEIKTAAAEVSNKGFRHNEKLKADYNDKVNAYADAKRQHGIYIDATETVLEYFDDLPLKDKEAVVKVFKENLQPPTAPVEPSVPNYIANDGEKITAQNPKDYCGEAAELVKKLQQLRKDYAEAQNTEQVAFDVSGYDEKIEQLNLELEKAKRDQKIFEAVQSFYDWKGQNDHVQELNKDYTRLLAKVDTGVEGLKIVPEENGDKLEMFLTYNGTYDADYFRNKKKEYRKLSSYSGTQKPMIALLVQNYLLSKKPKALRYMFIDDTPIDNRTRAVMEKMCIDLDIHIFVNVTGDFEQSSLKAGEMLIEGGEVLV